MNLPAPQNPGAMQLPAHLQGFTSNKLSQQVAANIGTSAPPYVSIQGNKFTLIDAAGNEQPVGAYDPALGVYLDCVVFDVGDHISKVYFDKAFDPAAGTYGAPPCWSDNGLAPSRQAAQPQAPLCATCPKNEWGSATSKVSGKGVKACHDLQKVAVLVPGFPTLFQLRIPPNSLKNFRSYAEYFAPQQFDMDVMITRVSFEPQGVGTLLFRAVNWIDEAIGGVITQARAAKATDALVGRNDVARDPNQPVAIAAPQGQQAPIDYAAAQQMAAPAAPFVPAQPAPTAAAPMAPQFSAPQGQPLANPTQQATPTAPAQGFAPTAFPSEQPQQVSQPQGAPAEATAPRRRGRARNAAAEAPQAPAAPQQAPFPHPGQQAAPPPPAFAGAPLPGGAAPAPQAPQNFGIGGGVAPDPALAAALSTAFGPR